MLELADAVRQGLGQHLVLQTLALGQTCNIKDLICQKYNNEGYVFFIHIRTRPMYAGGKIR